jgi:hypothetical protein
MSIQADSKGTACRDKMNSMKHQRFDNYLLIDSYQDEEGIIRPVSYRLCLGTLWYISITDNTPPSSMPIIYTKVPHQRWMDYYWQYEKPSLQDYYKLVYTNVVFCSAKEVAELLVDSPTTLIDTGEAHHPYKMLIEAYKINPPTTVRRMSIKDLGDDRLVDLKPDFTTTELNEIESRIKSLRLRLQQIIEKFGMGITDLDLYSQFMQYAKDPY